MTTVHSLCLTKGYNQYRVEPANDGVYFALPTTKTEIGIWSLQNLQSNPVILSGHRQPVSALSFGLKTSPKLLCSSAADYVIVWNIQTARDKFIKGERITGTIIGTTLGEVNHCCFNKDDTIVAACVESTVFILKSNVQSVLAQLEGHSGQVTRAEFCPHYSSTLVTISDDRTFKVWDVKAFSLVYESSIITSSSLISLAMNWSDPHVTIGSSDGICRTYDLTDGNNFRSLYQIDVTKAVSKQREKIAKLKSDSVPKGTVTVTKRGTWKKPNAGTEVESSSQQGQAILNLHFSYPVSTVTEGELAPQFKNSTVNNILESNPPVLVVVTTGAVLQFNAKNLETLNFFDFHDPMSSHHESSHTVNAAEMAVVAQSPGAMILWALLGTIFENELNVVQIGLSDSGLVKKDSVDFDSTLSYVISGMKELGAEPDGDSKSDLSIIAVEALCEKSPLRSELIPQSSSESKAKGAKPPGFDRRKKPDTMNQPLTFKPKVRSSGYTQAPRATMFKPKVNKPLKSSSQTVKRSTSDNKLFHLDYPMDSDPPTELQDMIHAAERPTPVNRIVFSNDGHSIACALANKTAALFRVPIGRNSSKVYVGHNGNVNSVSWNQSGDMVITASDDKTASIWTKTSSEPIMKFETVANNMNVNKEQAKPDKTNTAYPKEIKQAQFFFMDKFVLLTCGGLLYLYKYYLDPAKDEIKRYLTKSRYKLVQSWDTASQMITSMAAVNAFHSHLVICAGSNRDIDIFDLNHGSVATSFEDSHSRPVHSLCLNKSSSYASQPASAYNIFASAAPADCIKLWDVRSQGCVQRLEGHLNKAHSCGLAISPCGKYLATGSEDRLVYVFDLRTGTYCDRMRGNTDVVTDVTFHPAEPMLVSASLDGNIMSYVPE